MNSEIMEIPQSFRPNKDLDGNVERLLKKEYRLTEEEQWEIADRIAKYLVEEKDLEYQYFFWLDNKDPLLLEAAKKLSLEHEVETVYPDIVGKVNNKLVKYWLRK